MCVAFVFCMFCMTRQDRKANPEIQLVQVEKSLVQVVIDIRRIRNALLPVAQLPYDVLQHIFSLSQYEIPIRRKVYEDRRTFLEDHGGASTHISYHISNRWLHFLHVSKSWREAAIACSSLWTNFSLHHYSKKTSSLIRSILRNSLSRPLHIQIVNARTDSMGYQHRALEALLAHVSRFEHLCLLDIPDNDLTILTDAEVVDLEALVLRRTDHNEWRIPRHQGIDTLLGNCSGLKYLTLAHHPPWAVSSTYLRQLDLRDFTFFPDTFHTLLDLMENSRNLEDLKLSGVYSDFLSPTGGAKTKRVVHLPSLRRLLLEHVVIAELLPHMKLSDDVAITLESRPESGRMSGPLSSKTFLRHILVHHTRLFQVRSLVITAEEANAWRLAGIGHTSAWTFNSLHANSIQRELEILANSTEELWMSSTVDDPPSPDLAHSHPYPDYTLYHSSEILALLLPHAHHLTKVVIATRRLNLHCLDLLKQPRTCPNLKTLQISTLR